jgi:hypothetical protein
LAIWPTSIAQPISAPISGISAERVEIGNHFRGNLKHRRLKILAKMIEGRRARNQSDAAMIGIQRGIFGL